MYRRMEKEEVGEEKNQSPTGDGPLPPNKCEQRDDDDCSIKLSGGVLHSGSIGYSSQINGETYHIPTGSGGDVEIYNSSFFLVFVVGEIYNLLGFFQTY